MTYKRSSNSSEKAVAARKSWDAKNLERVSVALPKGKKELIRKHAERQGESVNGFINRAIDEAIERDQKQEA